MRFLVPVLAVAILAAIGLTAQETIFHTSAQIVTVTVSVTDTNGRPISDMKAGEFTLLDDSRSREIRSISQDLNVPLTLGLVADNSGSQVHYIERHRASLLQFLRQVLQEGDRAFLVSVPGPARLLEDLTGSVDRLEQAVDTLKNRRWNHGETVGRDCKSRWSVRCGTLIWNGIWGAASLRLRKIEGRKAILALTDGQDTGSEHNLDAVIEAAQAADAPVYTIGTEPFGKIGRIHPVLAVRNTRGLGHLRRLSEETGGSFFDAPKDPAKVFAQIEAELRHLYVLSFVLPERDRDGKFHKLTVKSSRPGTRVRARAGYVAN